MMGSLRTVRTLLLCGTAAGAPLCWWGRAHHGLALASLLALGVAVGVMQLAPRAGYPMGVGLQILWLLPFCACWGLGQGLGLFDRLGWWDLFSHAAGGAAVYALHWTWVRPRLRLPGAARAAVGLLLALGAGALWELGEFGSDLLLGTVTQYGLSDTMVDLLLDLIGAAGLALALALAPRGLALPRILAAPEPAES